MVTSKKSANKKWYWILIFLAVIIGFVFYVILQDQFSTRFLIFFSGLPYLLFVTGSFGLLWPKIKPTGDEEYISHTLLIGLLFIILFFIHVWIILPNICPNFGECLGV
ncbi:hypothetical protein [Algibacter sp. R77976]|uniref:hypothetical protein n=1 Tax=Algibacter sp. R77976 TaxID=3093873 RepID=UPI0037C62304